MQKELNKKILAKLLIGAIQPFQVEDELRLAGIAAFEAEKSKKEILKAYNSEQKRY